MSDDFSWGAEARDRLKRGVRAFGTQEELAAASGIPKPTLQKILAGNGDPGISRVTKLASVLGLSMDYLLTGRTTDPARAAIDNMLGGVERALSPLIGRRVNTKPTANDDDEFVSVSVHDVQISAGEGLMAIREGQSSDHWRFPRRWLSERFSDLGGLRLGRIVGDSMEPELRDGDSLLFNVNKRALADGIYVVRLDDALMVKRVQVQGATIRLLSTNPIYAPTVIGQADHPDRFEIIGKAEWTGKMMG